MNEPKFALSIHQPWSWLICAGLKDIENRVWWVGGAHTIPMRIYVHAGQTVDGPAVNDVLHRRIGNLTEEQMASFILARNTWGIPAIIGEVDIVDCVREHPSPWFNGPFGFVLRNAMFYGTPIPCRGRLGFWKPVLP